MCVCVMAKCVWWGRCVCLEKGSGFNVVCKVVGVRWIFLEGDANGNAHEL